MSTDAPYFGIDFGTTNSRMAWYDPEKGEAKTIKNAEGEDKTPSLVYYGEDEILVGNPVQNLLEDSEDYDEAERTDVTQRVVKSIKRNLLDPPVIPIPGRKPLRPVEVVAEILKKLKRDAQEGHFQEEIERVVITHPAVFSPQEWRVLSEAAMMAGFSRVESLEEPTAAAVTVARVGQKVGKGVMIYDLGAGTFDLSVVVQEEDGSFRVAMEPEGNPRCGGDDFDRALYDYCDEIAREKLGRHISPAEGVLDLAFLVQCRSRKENLSTSKESRFSSMLFAEDGSVKFFKHKVERATFEGLISDQVKETARKTSGLFEKAKGRVDTVVLIGGASRVPLVGRLLGEALPVKPREFAERDYAVALGAAYHAYELWNEPKVDEKAEEYRRSLKICWQDGKLTWTEVEWLENLAKQELGLSPEAAAGVEREVLGDTVEAVLERQEKTTRDRYRKILELGWKDKKLDALRQIPPARLDMLLDNQELFRDYDFDDCPVSAAEREEMLGDTPWADFTMVARVVTEPALTPVAVTERLRAVADELGLSEDQASTVEREVLGDTVKEHLERQEEQSAHAALHEEYRNALKKAGEGGSISYEAKDSLDAMARRLHLDSSETDGIEREVLGDTVATIWAEKKDMQRRDEEPYRVAGRTGEDKAGQPDATEAAKKRAKKLGIDLSRVKGSGPNGRIFVGDVVRDARQQEQERDTDSSHATRQTGGEETGEPDATDAAKQKAEELGVDLGKVEGSGAGGRITVKDVVAYGASGDNGRATRSDMEGGTNSKEKRRRKTKPTVADLTRKGGKVTKLCAQYEGSSYWVGGAIPQDKLTNARLSYPIPGTERVIALADTTTFSGKADQGFAVCENGIYWKNNWNDPKSGGVMSWNKFARISIRSSGEVGIVLGEGNLLRVEHCGLSREQALKMLLGIQSLISQPYKGKTGEDEIVQQLNELFGV